MSVQRPGAARIQDGVMCAVSVEETLRTLSLCPQTEVVRKVATSFFCLLVFLSVCKVFPVERNIDDDFIANVPVYAQVVYLYLSMLTTRPKYYFVWTLGESLKHILRSSLHVSRSCLCLSSVSCFPADKIKVCWNSELWHLVYVDMWWFNSCSVHKAQHKLCLSHTSPSHLFNLSWCHQQRRRLRLQRLRRGRLSSLGPHL